MSKAIPYLISNDSSGKKLVSLPTKNKLYKEEWLQELLFKYPDILPVDRLDEEFAPPISLGREIASIDNLFISPKGLITIVETKLWRNPEAHRTVVAQILDYAQTLSTWSYKKLDDTVRKCMSRLGKGDLGIYQIVKKQIRNLEFGDIEFEARVQNCLENGKFALLIVGDRIYPETTQLAETIQSAPHMQYSLGFVELQCFKFNKDEDWPLVVVPSFITKTKEITRAIVKVVYEEKKPEVAVTTPETEKASPSKTSLEEFIVALPSNVSDTFKSYITKWIQTGYIIYWGVVGFSLRINWNGKLITIFDAYPTYAGIFMEKYVDKYEMPKDKYDVYKSSLMNSSAISSTFASKKRYINFENMSEEDVNLLLESTDKFVAAITKSSRG